MTANIPYTTPCTDPRHTGPIRKQLGCTGPDPATLPPIEPGQVYRPAPDNGARLTNDRATVTFVRQTDPLAEPDIEHVIATVDLGTPVLINSTLPASNFRRWYVLDAPEPSPEDEAPEPAPEPPAETVERALALLHSLDAVAYVLIRPTADGTLDVTTYGNNVNALDAARAFRGTAKELKKRAKALPDELIPLPGIPECPADCPCRTAAATELEAGQ
ncbi:MULTISPECIES: hypothetical protein [unclassified Streptomyces]|uniref:hypothetical protein n=1 Tax=unclassified Streptomyces TaxID=2593676 RepID=UPI0035DD4117